LEGKPQRWDAVESFLIRHRSRFNPDDENPLAWAAHMAIDDMLKRYRMLADKGMSLDDEARLI